MLKRITIFDKKHYIHVGLYSKSIGDASTLFLYKKADLIDGDMIVTLNSFRERDANCTSAIYDTYYILTKYGIGYIEQDEISPYFLCANI